MTRVVLADDQAVVRAGLRLILESNDGFEVVGEAGDGLAAVELARAEQPDVVLMDIRMPRLDGIEATRRILAAPANRSHVLVLTTYGLDEYVYKVLRAGASGFLLKTDPPERLVAGVRTVAQGEAMLAPAITRRLIERFVQGPSPDRAPPPVVEALTDRELEVLRLVARGLSNAEIAAHLVVSHGTVKTHVGRVLTKLGMRDRVQAVVFAYEAGIVTPGAPD